MEDPETTKQCVQTHELHFTETSKEAMCVTLCLLSIILYSCCKA